MRTLFPFLLALLFVSCLKEDELKKPFASYVPPALSDGWEISSPAAENIDPAALTGVYEAFHADEDAWQVRSLLVFRNGKLVAESYTKDESDRTTPRAVWSATKQVVGLLIGMAIDNKVIGSVDDPLSDYLPEIERFPDKKDITIADLLTMRSGIAYSNDGLAGQTDDILRQKPRRINDFILGLPLEHPPGQFVHYKDCDPQLLMSALQAKSSVPSFVPGIDVLFLNMGIKNFRWNRYKDGVFLGGFGILTTPRELAKFGQLVLNKGQWNGQTLVSASWIEQMTTPWIEDLYGYQFGYLWWIDESRNMFVMSGHGGQYVFVVPEKNLLVVMTAEVNTQGDFQFRRDAALEWLDRVVEAAF
jgi:CubicO group peptidase (beta-lactamase class C family)